jgi:hypothetical protein
LQAFDAWKGGVRTEGLTPAAMFELYKNTIFVPSPRGNVRLDCFRHYEATLSGAIPVVAGDRSEIVDTFCKEGDPPWIIGDTWEHAVEQCKAELEAPELLQKRQERLLAWWKARVNGVQRRISEALRTA